MVACPKSPVFGIRQEQQTILFFIYEIDFNNRCSCLSLLPDCSKSKDLALCYFLLWGWSGGILLSDQNCHGFLFWLVLIVFCLWGFCHWSHQNVMLPLTCFPQAHASWPPEWVATWCKGCRSYLVLDCVAFWFISGSWLIWSISVIH